MVNKKTKLTLSGIAKKSIENIELAKTQSKNTVVIEKKTSRFAGKSSFNRFTDHSKKQQKKSFFSAKPTGFSKPQIPVGDNFEKRIDFIQLIHALGAEGWRFESSLPDQISPNF